MVIPHAGADLGTRLELGNQPGPYDASLQRNGKVFAVAWDAVRLENHEPILRVKIDLGHAPGGQYDFYVRPVAWERRNYRVILQ